jgi:hypothetical protein
VLSQAQCAPLDGRGHLFIAISYSGLPASALSYGCAARTLPKALVPKVPQLCPKADLRNVVYGTLGPQGAAIRYRDPTTGRIVTQNASESEHAYLVVTRPTAEHPARGGWYSLTTPGSALTEVRYRDGSTCHVVSARRHGGARPCPAKGFVPVPPTRAQVRAALSATAATKLERPLSGPPGHQQRGAPARRLTVAFRAPVATPNASAYYIISISVGRASKAARRCGFAGMSAPVARTVRGGQPVRQDFWIPPRCHERLTVTASLHTQGKNGDVDGYGGGRNPKDDAVVGRTTVRPR